MALYIHISFLAYKTLSNNDLFMTYLYILISIVHIHGINNCIDITGLIVTIFKLKKSLAVVLNSVSGLSDFNCYKIDITAIFLKIVSNCDFPRLDSRIKEYNRLFRATLSVFVFEWWNSVEPR